MTPIHFGRPDRRLFGVFTPRDGGPGRGAALLLNPFGQEAIRVHRLFRTLGIRLSRGGFDVLRFDYFGTGDSAGDDVGGELAGWCEDIRTAHAELQRRSQQLRIVWAGSGLGASLASLTAATVPNGAGPARLVLWMPVVDGPAYRDELRRKHVEALEGTYSFADPEWRRALERDPRSFADEAMGFGISPQLDRELRALDLSAIPPPPTSIHVIADQEDQAIAKCRARLHPSADRFTHLDETFDLAAEELRGAPLVPQRTLRALHEAITGD